MSALTFGYYPGCSGQGTSMEYESSTRAVCSALDVRLQEIPDWSCCGSTPAHTVDHVLSSALAARNLAQAEGAGISTTITPCPSCLKNLHNAIAGMQDPLFAARVDALTLRPLQQEHTVKSVLQVLAEDVGLEAIRAKVRTPLKGLKVVPYYGCLMTRPGRHMLFDNAENPVSLDNILTALGAQVLPFPLKTNCCGAAFGIPTRGAVTRLSGQLLEMAADLGAHAIVVACPLCQMNLDLRQGQVNSANKTQYRLAVPYFTQLMAYAFGVDEKSIGFAKLNIPITDAFAAMHVERAALEQAEAEAAAKAAAKAAKTAAKAAAKAAKTAAQSATAGETQ